jgi:hypothetical protein
MESEDKSTVTIKINSPGGSTYDAMAIIGRIRSAKCYIVTEGYGQIMSAASLILASGRKRRINKYAFLMWHEASYGVGVARQVIYKTGIGSKVPVPSSVGKTYDIYATCNLLSDNQTLWKDNYKRSTDYDTPANVIVEWITDDFGENFPYKERRKKR